LGIRAIDIFAFDLDTFRDDDQSYDIYGIFEGFDVSPYCLVGRDFFRFVNDFALGDELAKSACLAPHFVELGVATLRRRASRCRMNNLWTWKGSQR